MAYKDKTKHREASRLSMQRYRARQKALKAEARGITQPAPVIPTEVIPGCETPEGIKQAVPENYGLENCTCRHCAINKRNGNKLIINHGPYKTRAELGPKEVNRVALEGDVDFTDMG
ncbi:MAG: hypothetical protein FVQ85_20010 [Planctomycetes bacterium]|nr:hypothetical protein [Planctomycetota bacterium]